MSESVESSLRGIKVYVHQVKARSHYYRGLFGRWTLKARFNKERRYARRREKARLARHARRMQRLRSR